MMRLTIFIGVVHLTSANLVRAWRMQQQWTALEPLGWSAVMAGGYLWWLATNSVSLAATAQGLLAAGVGLILLFAGGTPVRRVADIPRRVLEGLLAIAGNLSKAFGDILSYLRLFALSLAGSSLAETFNSLANSISQMLAGSGLFVAVLILLFGHSLNLLLGLMSGVVHGLRLNFIEFYSWGLSGEGYPFRCFRRKTVSQ